MYVNPFPFGVFIGVISIVFIEVAILIGCALYKGGKKK